MTLAHRWAAALCLAMAGAAAHAGALQALSAFIDGGGELSGQFEQTVTLSAAGSVPPRVSSGSFWLRRPNQFRFNYAKPYRQMVLADGQTLWLHDLDINQVTRRNQADVLAQSPVALLSSRRAVQALQRDFELSEEPPANGLQWLQGTPRQPNASLRRLRLGFDSANMLRVIDTTDAMGQQSVMRLEQLSREPAPVGWFVFTPPPGADVVSQ